MSDPVQWEFSSTDEEKITFDRCVQRHLATAFLTNIQFSQVDWDVYRQSMHSLRGHKARGPWGEELQKDVFNFLLPVTDPTVQRWLNALSLVSSWSKTESFHKFTLESMVFLPTLIPTFLILSPCIICPKSLLQLPVSKILNMTSKSTRMNCILASLMPDLAK